MFMESSECWLLASDFDLNLSVICSKHNTTIFFLLPYVFVRHIKFLPKANLFYLIWIKKTKIKNKQLSNNGLMFSFYYTKAKYLLSAHLIHIVVSNKWFNIFLHSQTLTAEREAEVGTSVWGTLFSIHSRRFCFHAIKICQEKSHTFYNQWRWQIFKLFFIWTKSNM